jgi:hypothetical protein
MMMHNGNNGYGNGVMTVASTGTTSYPPTTNAQAQALKTYFKTPEGRYKLQYEKTHPPGLLPYSHGKSVSLVGFLFNLSLRLAAEKVGGIGWQNERKTNF